VPLPGDGGAAGRLVPGAAGRYFAFDAAFAPGERVARANSATGDGWLIWFAPQGVVIRGFDHESPVSPWARDPVAPWPGLFDGLPDKLRHGPRLEVGWVESVTFCLWWDVADPGWRAGVVAQPDAEDADPDGSGSLLAELNGPAEYQVQPRSSMSARSPWRRSRSCTGTSR
jgi:hypothetical protein